MTKLGPERLSLIRAEALALAKATFAFAATFAVLALVVALR